MRRIRALLCGVGAALWAVDGAAQPGFDWPQWRGPNRDGISAETNWSFNWPREGPRRLWAAKVGVGWSGIAVAGNRVFTMGNVGDVDDVLCLDANTGRLMWEVPYVCLAADPSGYPGPRCTPTVDGRLVFTLSRRGDLACINGETGVLIWGKQLVNELGARVPQWGFSGSPLVEGPLLIVETGAAGRSLMAFDKLTGRLVWANGNDGAGYSSHIAFDHAGTRLVAMFSASGLTVRAVRDGRVTGTFPWRTTYNVHAATPVLVDSNRLFISSGYGSGCAMLQLSNGVPRAQWTGKQMRNHVASCVLYQDHLYGFDDNQNAQFRCISVANGNVRWAVPSLGKGSLVLAGDKLIILTDSGRLVVADAAPDTYGERASAQVIGGRDTWSPPVLSRGRIYVRSLMDLVCLDVSVPPPGAKPAGSK